MALLSVLITMMHTSIVTPYCLCTKTTVVGGGRAHLAFEELVLGQVLLCFWASVVQLHASKATLCADMLLLFGDFLSTRCNGIVFGE